jgi:PAS domain S-box-containing protein
MLDKIEVSHRDLLDSFDENIALLDYSGNIIHVNKAWEEFYRDNTGGGNRDWNGINYLDICSSARGRDSAEALDAYVGIQSVARGETRCFELEYPCHCPGEERWFLLRVTKMTGPLPLILVAHINITARKQAEETVLKQNEVLERINADLESLVYKITHDIKSPINSIKGLINLSRLVQGEEELRTYLDLMGKSIGQLGGYVHDIIEVSRSTRHVTIPEKVNFEQIIGEIVDSIDHMDERQNVDIRRSIRQSRDFYSDRNLLHTILANLVTNAVIYHDNTKDSPYVEISVEVHDQGAKISVGDNGQGIGSAHMQKIFQKFYRANSSRQGSGLGLFLVKESVERLEGSIDVSSKPGSGTVFTLFIPELKASPADKL